jgi:membrane-associated phospholipid phosphatase
LTPGALREFVFEPVKNYTFVDYATQGYTALVAVLILFLHNGTVPDWQGLLAIHGLILVAIHWLIQWQARPRPNRIIDFLRHFYPVLLYTFFFTETGRLNRMVFKEYLDPLAIHWDQVLFGFQPSVLFMDKLPYLWVSEVFYASYFSYYVMIAGVGLALYLRDRAQFFHYVSVVSFVFYCCYLIYVFIPIIGPRVFFHEIGGYNLPEVYQRLAPVDAYPESVRSGPFFQIMAWIYRTFEAPGAAMPSSHVAVAWCTVFFSFRYLRPIRHVHCVMATLLTLSTIYCRYHYAVDVMAGLVTAAVLVPAGHALYLRYRVDKCGTVCTPVPQSPPACGTS